MTVSVLIYESEWLVCYLFCLDDMKRTPYVGTAPDIQQHLIFDIERPRAMKAVNFQVVPAVRGHHHQQQ